MDAVESAYGAGNVLRVSSLLTLSSQGRRLYTSGSTYSDAKFAIWALPPHRFPLIAYIDLDVSHE